jgi:hypothetical protein
MEAVDRADFHAIHVFTTDTFFGDDKCHRYLLIIVPVPDNERGTLVISRRKSISLENIAGQAGFS